MCVGFKILFSIVVPKKVFIEPQIVKSIIIEESE